MRGLESEAAPGTYGNGPPSSTYGRRLSPDTQVVGAIGDFLGNYIDMRNAWTVGADVYFHCIANCESARRGPYADKTACTISDAREGFDQYIKGDSRGASAYDQLANASGCSAGALSPLTCDVVCSPFRPNGMPAR